MFEGEDSPGSFVVQNEAHQFFNTISHNAVNKKKNKTKKNKNKVPAICIYALMDQCEFRHKCNKVHSTKPYQWQCKNTDDEWHNVTESDNEKIQANYAVPEKLNSRDCPVNIKIDDEVVYGWINFNLMRLVVNGKFSLGVRLLTTPSSVHSTSRCSTVWGWFWKDDGEEWHEYGVIANSRKEVVKPYISSKEIETAYAEKRKLLWFRTERHEYELDFFTMMQRNINEGTERPVRRRPKLPIDSKPGLHVSTVSSNYVDHLPTHWDKSVLGGDVAYNWVELSRECPEWMEIQTRFAQSMSSFTLRNIFRIQNEELWEFFSCKKKWMEKSLSNVNEKFLFHGTRNRYIDIISQQGFDWRRCGSSVGTLFGKGSYFARDASYSKNYTDCRKMFLARVLVGDSTHGNPSYVTPPEKNSGGTYNSCVDNMLCPSIYVIFEHSQTYPEYLISY